MISALPRYTAGDTLHVCVCVCENKDGDFVFSMGKCVWGFFRILSLLLVPDSMVGLSDRPWDVWSRCENRLGCVFWLHSLFHSSRGLCYPSPVSPSAPRGSWIVIHPCTTALSCLTARLAAYGGQALAAFGKGEQQSRAGGSLPLGGGSVGAEPQPGGKDRSLVTTGLVRDAQPSDWAQQGPAACLPHLQLLTISCALQKPLSWWKCLPFSPQLCSGAVSWAEEVE